MSIKSVLFSLFLFLPISVLAHNPLVIAHRGASGYLPDHTLAAKAMAYQMSPDFIEQDLVMTKDDKLVVLHDLYLNQISDVADKFPKRARTDNKFYVIDFTLAELKTLNISSPFTTNNAGRIAKYPNRFPLFKSSFSVHTFAQEIELIQGLNKVTGKNIGIYPEIKAPWFHQQHGKDITKAVLSELKKYGYQTKADKVYLQSFDPSALMRAKNSLFSELNMNIKLVQLVAETHWQETQVYNGKKWVNYNYDNMLTAKGLEKVAKYADGIGPWHGSLMVEKENSDALATAKTIIAAAKSHALAIHPYTFRLDDLPEYASSYSQWVQLFQQHLKVDGLFTDFSAETIEILASNKVK